MTKSTISEELNNNEKAKYHRFIPMEMTLLASSILPINF